MAITISFSKWKTFTGCQKAAYYKYVLNIEPRARKESLTKGKLIHSCLEAYYQEEKYKAIAKPLKEFRKGLKGMFDEERALFEQTPNDVERILMSYHCHWRDIDRVEVLGVEKEIVLPIVKGVDLKVIIDLIMRDDIGAWVMDHKSHKNEIPPDTFRMNDVQTTLYYWVGEQIEIPDLVGVILNYIKTVPPAIPELINNGKGLSKAKSTKTDYWTYLKAIQDNGFSTSDYSDFLSSLKTGPNNSFFNRQRLTHPKAMTKNILREVATTALEMDKKMEAGKPELFTRSLSWTCDRMCEFRPLCMAELQGHDTAFIIANHYKPRKEEEYGNVSDE